MRPSEAPVVFIALPLLSCQNSGTKNFPRPPLSTSSHLRIGSQINCQYGKGGNRDTFCSPLTVSAVRPMRSRAHLPVIIGRSESELRHAVAVARPHCAYCLQTQSLGGQGRSLVAIPGSKALDSVSAFADLIRLILPASNLNVAWGTS